MQPMEWENRSNHAGHKFCYSTLDNQAKIIRPGITVTLEVKSPVVVDSCYYLFTIYRLIGRVKTRAYQLEVIPAHKLGHRDPMQTLFGPHEHFGEATFPVTDPTVTCSDWQACYSWFMNRCNLLAPMLPPP